MDLREVKQYTLVNHGLFYIPKTRLSTINSYRYVGTQMKKKLLYLQLTLKKQNFAADITVFQNGEQPLIKVVQL